MAMLALPFQTAQAALVGTDQLVTAQRAQESRQKVVDFLTRADLKNQLQAMGINVDNAKARVDALTDEEVQKLAGKLDTLPAGARSNGAVAAAVIIIALIIYWVYK